MYKHVQYVMSAVRVAYSPLGQLLPALKLTMSRCTQHVSYYTRASNRLARIRSCYKVIGK